MENKKGNLMDKIFSLAKRRGFVFAGSEIYGGLSGIWDFGPLGVLLKNNIKKEWIGEIVFKRDDVFLIESAILMNRAVWEASGHLENFTDPLVDCRACKKRYKADDVAKVCPECRGELTAARPFNTMFKTFVGPVEDTATETYLRPETAQGIFINFENVLNVMRTKLPFGIAQVGKSFRNEITPGNFIFRTREFEQMELEYFVKPIEAEKWHGFWINERYNWFLNLGIKKENLKPRQHKKEELSHYSKGTTDLEYKFPFIGGDGFAELEGIANRGDYDLSQHSKHSGKNLMYFDEETREKYFPYIIEPSLGVERAFLAFLLDAYFEEEVKGEKRIVLRLDRRLAPIKAAVLPLVKKDQNLVDKAKSVFGLLKQGCIDLANFVVDFDEVDSIGRRYRRQDEIGTPYCLTIDSQTLEDETVTVRDRDTLEQDRVTIKELAPYLREKLYSLK